MSIGSSSLGSSAATTPAQQWRLWQRPFLLEVEGEGTEEEAKSNSGGDEHSVANRIGALEAAQLEFLDRGRIAEFL